MRASLNETEQGRITKTHITKKPLLTTTPHGKLISNQSTRGMVFSLPFLSITEGLVETITLKTSLVLQNSTVLFYSIE